MAVARETCKRNCADVTDRQTSPRACRSGKFYAEDKIALPLSSSSDYSTRDRAAANAM
jgi:hypothetical protein